MCVCVCVCVCVPKEKNLACFMQDTAWLLGPMSVMPLVLKYPPHILHAHGYHQSALPESRGIIEGG